MPEPLHEEVRRRAKARRMTVRDYVLELIERDQVRISMQEWLAELASRPDPGVEVSGDEIARWIDEEWEEREAELDRRAGLLRDRPGAAGA